MPGAGRLARAIRKAGRDNGGGGDSWKYDSNDNRGPRSFPTDVKAACWEKAAVVPGRDPDRWRQDSLGNVVFRKLTACEGCLCYTHDHIIPYSKGGPSTLENCQILQTAANRAKGNKEDVTSFELQQKSVFCTLSKKNMDFVELSTYGDIKEYGKPGGCGIQ